jgi:UDP-N-acetylglucosamine 3-dehydrogenase
MENGIQLVGAGMQMQRNILPSLLLCGAQIDSVTTRSAAHSAAAVRKFGLPARAYAGLDEMLAAERGGKAVVVMQAGDAVPAVLRCLAAGKEVFVEKPCGLSLAEAQAVYAASRASGKGVCVGFMKRFAPVYCRLKETIDSGALGGVRSFRAAFCVDASGFCRSDADFVYFVAIHTLDLLRWLFGEVRSVRVQKNENGGGCSYAAVFCMESGAVGTASFENRTAWTRESESLCVTLENGFAESRELNRLTLHRSAAADAPWRDLSERDEVFSDGFGPASGTEKDLWLRGFAGEMRAFWEHGAPVSDDNLRTTQLCEAFLNALNDPKQAL